MNNMTLAAKLRVCALVCAIAGQLIVAPTVMAAGNARQQEIAQARQEFPTLNPAQAHVIAIIKEFVDLGKCPNKKFKEFADEIKQVLNGADAGRYAPVCNKLQEMVNRNEKNAIRFGKEFKAFEGLLPGELRSALETLKQKKNLKNEELFKIFKRRLAA